MSLEELVRESTPDFMDLQISAYIEERDDREVEVVRVKGEHNGETYGFEMAEHDDDLPQEVMETELIRFYERMVRVVIEDELQ